jgi:hypothetical protein
MTFREGNEGSEKMTIVKAVLLIPTVISGLLIAKVPSGVLKAASSQSRAAQTLELTLAPAILPPSPSAAPQTSLSPEKKTQRAHARVKEQQQEFDSRQELVSEQRMLTLVVARKIRLQRLLGALDQVAEASLQMSPERAAYLEPVIVDLAEQTVALSEDQTITRASTETDLDRLETTVERLVQVVGRMVEPELSI